MLDDACGVDIAATADPLDLSAIAPRVLTPAEQRALAAVDEPGRVRHVHLLWTMKEAYLKARGIGLRYPPRNVGFQFDGVLPRLAPQPRVPDAPRWWLWQSSWWCDRTRADSGPGEHVVAVAVRGRDGSPITLIRHEAPPTAGDAAARALETGADDRGAPSDQGER